MTQKEVIEFSNTNSQTSADLEPMIQDAVRNNPNVSYTRVNYDEDPDIVKALIASQPPTISPFFVSFVDGKAVASAAGLLSSEEINKLFKV